MRRDAPYERKASRKDAEAQRVIFLKSKMLCHVEESLAAGLETGAIDLSTRFSNSFLFFFFAALRLCASSFLRGSSLVLHRKVRRDAPCGVLLPLLKWGLEAHDLESW